MYCAVCDQGERVIAAIAVCQRCGGGVCRTHLHTFCYPAAPGGHAGVGAAAQGMRVPVVCEHRRAPAASSRAACCSARRRDADSGGGSAAARQRAAISRWACALLAKEVAGVDSSCAAGAAGAESPLAPFSLAVLVPCAASKETISFLSRQRIFLWRGETISLLKSYNRVIVLQSLPCSTPRSC